ncbi:hypothetical protein FQR65_LT13204 [Abscondita terminalis]|nr:hypothetical protein FQR65_LT13204 [Abscondita terminalis]
MKIAILFLLFGCATVVLGSCDCDKYKPYYELLQCNSTCRRGNCITAYKCKAIIIMMIIKKCYFRGNYYDLYYILPDRYPCPNGAHSCRYVCLYYKGVFIFVPFGPILYLSPPSLLICNIMIELNSPSILQLGYGVIYRPNICRLQLQRVCKNCKNLGSFYDLIGCNSTSIRKHCASSYNCDDLMAIYDSQPGCYFKNNFYPLGQTLPDKYICPNGIALCDYVCLIVDSFYFFSGQNPVPIDYAPSPSACNDMYLLNAPIVTRIGYAVTYIPEKCYIKINLPSEFPPANCDENCCDLDGKNYKIGSSYVIDGLKFKCLCPPLMTFFENE